MFLCHKVGGASPDVNGSELGHSDFETTPIDPDYDGASEGSAYEQRDSKNDMVNNINILITITVRNTYC